MKEEKQKRNIKRGSYKKGERKRREWRQKRKERIEERRRKLLSERENVERERKHSAFPCQTIIHI